MDSRELIDVQFDRAVEIVQSLPKNGPIQTGYEEKLTMYSLYKQATVGNVKAPRPGIWDMLGRAKWDAWAKHKDLDQYEAKWLYVDALLKVLRRYSDKTTAQDYVRELESYGGDPANIVMSGSLKKPGSSSSASTASDDHASAIRYPPTHAPPHTQYINPSLSQSRIPRHQQEETTSEEETEDEDEVPATLSVYEQSQRNRPQSSMSSHRYRTPMAGSMAMSPPPMLTTSGPIMVPQMQPRPGFESMSAFEGPSPQLGPAYPPAPSHPSHYSQSPSHIYPAHPGYRPPSRQFSGRRYSVPSRSGPGPMPSLEGAVENVQAHLAALSERLETLESLTGHPRRSNQSLSPRVGSGPGTPADGNDDSHEWNVDDMGMWTLVLKPLSRTVASFRQLSRFLAHNENRSPTLIVVRRLFLDISFMLCVLALARALWRKSGVRRGEVNAALVALWRAITGTKKARAMVDRGV